MVDDNSLAPIALAYVTYREFTRFCVATHLGVKAAVYANARRDLVATGHALAIALKPKACHVKKVANSGSFALEHIYQIKRFTVFSIPPNKL